MFKYRIFVPNGLVFEGEATMLVVPSVEGELGILEQHLNFFSLLKTGIVKIYKDAIITNNFFIEGGILKIKDEVLIFTEEVVDLNKFDRRSYEERYEKSKQQLAIDPANTKNIKEHEFTQILLTSSNARI